MLATYWAALAVATHLPPRAVPQTNLPDKFLHYVAYAGLTALLLIRLHVGGRLNGRTLLITIAIVATWGAIDELLQTPFGRTCDLYDWLADMIGCLTVAIAALVFGWLRRFRAGT